MRSSAADPQRRNQQRKRSERAQLRLMHLSNLLLRQLDPFSRDFDSPKPESGKNNKLSVCCCCLQHVSECVCGDKKKG